MCVSAIVSTIAAVNTFAAIGAFSTNAAPFVVVDASHGIITITSSPTVTRLARIAFAAIITIATISRRIVVVPIFT